MVGCVRVSSDRVGDHGLWSAGAGSKQEGRCDQRQHTNTTTCMWVGGGGGCGMGAVWRLFEVCGKKRTQCKDFPWQLLHWQLQLLQVAQFFNTAQLNNPNWAVRLQHSLR